MPSPRVVKFKFYHVLGSIVESFPGFHSDWLSHALAISVSEKKGNGVCAYGIQITEVPSNRKWVLPVEPTKRSGCIGLQEQSENQNVFRRQNPSVLCPYYVRYHYWRTAQVDVPSLKVVL